MQKLQYPKPFVLSLSKGRPCLSTPRKKNSPSTSSGRTEGGKTMSFLFPHALNLPLQLDAALRLHPAADFLAERLDIGAGSGAGVDEEIGVLLRSEEHTSELQSLMRISYAF